MNCRASGPRVLPGRSIGVACVIGLLMGIFQGAWALVDYVVIPMPGELAVKWFISELAQVVLLAIVTALVYKPATVSRA
jgi:hypothetical protein